MDIAEGEGAEGARVSSPCEVVLIVAEQKVQNDFPVLDDIKHVVLQLPQQRLRVFLHLQFHHLQVQKKLAVRLNAQLEPAVPLDLLLLVRLNHFRIVLDLSADPMDAAGAERLGDEVQLEPGEAIELQEESHRPQQVRLVVAAALADPMISLQHPTDLPDEVVEGGRENLDAELAQEDADAERALSLVFVVVARQPEVGLHLLLVPVEVFLHDPLVGLVADQVALIGDGLEVLVDVSSTEARVAGWRQSLLDLRLLQATGREELLLIRVFLRRCPLHGRVRQRRNFLLAEDQKRYFEGVQVELVLVLGAEDVKDQLEHARLVKPPQNLVVHADVVVHLLLVLWIRRNLQDISGQHQHSFQ